MRPIIASMIGLRVGSTLASKKPLIVSKIELKSMDYLSFFLIGFRILPVYNISEKIKKRKELFSKKHYKIKLLILVKTNKSGRSVDLLCAMRRMFLL